MVLPVCRPAVERKACPEDGPVGRSVLREIPLAEFSVLRVFPPAVPQALKVFHPAAHRVRTAFRLVVPSEITAAPRDKLACNSVVFPDKSVGYPRKLAAYRAKSAGFRLATSAFPLDPDCNLVESQAKSALSPAEGREIPICHRLVSSAASAAPFPEEFRGRNNLRRLAARRLLQARLPATTPAAARTWASYWLFYEAD